MGTTAGCGGERNIELYQQLLNKTTTNFLIQDCHDSRVRCRLARACQLQVAKRLTPCLLRGEQAASDPHTPRAPPNATWCPFNT